MDLLTGLNERQKEAVLATEGPVLIIAGAGAGKTKVITHRLAYLIEKGVKPGEILAVTFTNKAANEMKERVGKLISSGRKGNSPTIGTFHSVATRILRENSRRMGFTKNFSILDEDDSLKLTRNALKKLGLNPKQFQPAKIASIISRQKSELIKLEDFAKEAGEEFFPKIISLVRREYENSLKKMDGLDFDDLIAETVYLFEKNPEILEKYQNKWRYIMVDEYQDTNRGQYVLTRLLAEKHKNICVVGDEDQSIYSWRGANFENIFKFEKDWPETRMIMLEENYRSVQKILKAANAVITRNKMRKSKNLFSQKSEGDRLSVFPARNESEEAEFIALKAKEIIENGTQPSEIAVLYRTNFQSRILEELFLSRGIPYQIVGTRFFDRKEVKDALSYLKAALNPNDLLSMERAVNEPPRGIGKASLLNRVTGKKNTDDKAKKLDDFFYFLKKIGLKSEELSASETLIFTVKQSGYEDYLKNGEEADQIRLDNLRELIVLSAKYDHLAPPSGILKFIEDVTLLTDQDSLDEKKEGVKLMTIHAAKGLEFKNVFVSGLEEGLFPSPRSTEPNEEEEERRLFYVALTRAKEKIFLSFAVSRTFFGGKQINKPSRFLHEIPEELLEAAAEHLNIIGY